MSTLPKTTLNLIIIIEMVIFVIPATFMQILVSSGLAAVLVTEGMSILVIGFVPTLSLLSLWWLFFKRNNKVIKEISFYHKFFLAVGLIISVCFFVGGLIESFSISPYAILFIILMNLFSHGGALITLGTILLYMRSNDSCNIKNLTLNLRNTAPFCCVLRCQ